MSGDILTPSQIVDQIKSQGLFDKIRKQCLEDLDTNPEYQLLQQRVSSYVSGFLQSQSWNPSTEKLKLREQLRSELCRTKMLTCGIDRLVRQALRLKIPKAFRDQVKGIVCGHYGINPDALNDKDSIPIKHDDTKQPLSFSNLIPSVDNLSSNPSITSPMVPCPQSLNQSSFPYAFSALSTVQPSVQPAVPCPMSSYIAPANNFIIPPNLYYQSVVAFNGQPVVPVQSSSNAQVTNSPEPKTNPIEFLSMQPAEMTVGESVECDDPMDIESLNSGSPVETEHILQQKHSDPSISPTRCVQSGQKEAFSIVVSETSHYGSKINFNDVSDDEKDAFNTSATKDDLRRYCNQSPPRFTNSQQVVSISTRKTTDFNCPVPQSNAFIALSESKYRDEHRQSKNLSDESEVSGLLKRTKSHSQGNRDINSPHSDTRNQTNFSRTSGYVLNESRSSRSPYSSSLRNEITKGSREKHSRSDRYDKRHDTNHHHRSTTSPASKSGVPRSPFGHLAHCFMESSKIVEPPRVSRSAKDRASIHSHSTQGRPSTRSHLSPDHAVRSKHRSANPYHNNNYGRNDSRSPDDFHSRSPSTSLSSVSGCTTDSTIHHLPVMPSDQGRSARHRERSDHATHSPDFKRLTRKLEIEARLREIESTERRLLTKHAQNFHSALIQSGNIDTIDRASDHRKHTKRH